MCGLHLDYQYELNAGTLKLLIFIIILYYLLIEEEIATETMIWKEILTISLKKKMMNFGWKRIRKIPKIKRKVVPIRKEVTNLEMDKSNRFIILYHLG